MRTIAASLAMSVTAVLGAAGVCAVEFLPARLGASLAGTLVCFLAFVLWPWSVLPAGIVGGVAVIKVVGDHHVTFVVLVHSVVLAAGGLALLVRRAVWATNDGPRRTRVDGPMALLVVLLLAGALYGLANGNAPHRVLVAAYEIAVIPGYFFLATHTLTTQRSLRAASILYIAAAAALAATELTVPGRHGGLLSVLAIPPLLVAASRTQGWRRGALVVLIALFAADVLLASYRAMWVATAVTLLILLVRASARVRRTVAAGAAAGALFTIAGIAVSTGLRSRYALLSEHLDDDAGYRTSESSVGGRVFAARPLTGDGLGQTTPHVYLPDFEVTNVGPTYHVFWMMILANLGLIGLITVLWPMLSAVRVGMVARDDYTLSLTALTCGFLMSAAFAGPSDGHWELGLLPAMTLLTRQLRAGPTDVEATGAHPWVPS
jgi:hypothetical protein